MNNLHVPTFIAWLSEEFADEQDLSVGEFKELINEFVNPKKKEKKLMTMEEIQNTPFGDKCDWADCMSSSWYDDFCHTYDNHPQAEEVMNEFLFEQREGRAPTAVDVRLRGASGFKRLSA